MPTKHKPGLITVTRADGTKAIQQPIGGRRAVPASLQRAVFARDGLCCRYCGYKHGDAKRFEIDHVIPVVFGGCDEMSNLVVACKRCNQAKGVDEWRPMTVPAARRARGYRSPMVISTGNRERVETLYQTPWPMTRSPRPWSAYNNETSLKSTVFAEQKPKKRRNPPKKKSSSTVVVAPQVRTDRPVITSSKKPRLAP
jgi:hypothetical protein